MCRITQNDPSIGPFFKQLNESGSAIYSDGKGNSYEVPRDMVANFRRLPQQLIEFTHDEGTVTQIARSSL